MILYTSKKLDVLINKRWAIPGNKSLYIIYLAFFLSVREILLIIKFNYLLLILKLIVPANAKNKPTKLIDYGFSEM